MYRILSLAVLVIFWITSLVLLVMFMIHSLAVSVIHTWFVEKRKKSINTKIRTCADPDPSSSLVSCLIIIIIIIIIIIVINAKKGIMD